MDGHFEDIGAENLSQKLRLSALESLQLLGQAGAVHHDMELRTSCSEYSRGSMSTSITGGNTSECLGFASCDK